MKNLIVSLCLGSCLFGAVQNSASDFIQNLNPAEEKYARSQWETLERSRDKANLRIMTFNMLFNHYDHTLPEEYRFESRLPRIVELLKYDQPDIVGTQELVEEQALALMEKIGSQYAFVGEQSMGDACIDGILFKHERFELLEEAAFQSPVPEREGRCNAINVVVLRDRKSGKTFAVINSHFPFNSRDGRIASARATKSIADDYAIRMPVFFMGDLNTFPNRPDLGVPFLDGDEVLRILNSGALKNASERSIIGHVGPIATFTSSPSEEDKAFVGNGVPGVVLDHIFVSDDIEVIIHATEEALIDGYFPSDHMPVFIDAVIR